MRASLLTRCLSATAAVLLLVACGGGSEEDGAAPQTTAEASSPAAETGEAPEADSDFCTKAQGIAERMNTLFTDSSDPRAVSEKLRSLSEDFRAVEPPEEIAADWTALADSFEEVATAFEGIDLADPEQAAELEARLQGLEAPLETSGPRLETYLAQECGINTGGTGTSPSS